MTDVEQHEDLSILAMSRTTLGTWFAILFVIAQFAAFSFGPEAWGTPRTFAGGVLLACWAFLMLFINRILIDGASSDPDQL